MEIRYEKSFEKDLYKISDNEIKKKVKEFIKYIKNIDKISEIRNLKKLKGYKTYYRLRLRNYRIGIEIIENTVYFVRILHRKDIYKYFPK